MGEEAWHKAGFAASSSLYEDLDEPYSPEWMEGVFSEDLSYGVLGSPCQSPAARCSKKSATRLGSGGSRRISIMSSASGYPMARICLTVRSRS